MLRTTTLRPNIANHRLLNAFGGSKFSSVIYPATEYILSVGDLFPVYHKFRFRVLKIKITKHINVVMYKCANEMMQISPSIKM